jgi:hypothetical protein
MQALDTMTRINTTHTGHRKKEKGKRKKEKAKKQIGKSSRDQLLHAL